MAKACSGWQNVAAAAASSMGLIILDDVFVRMRLGSIAATALAWRRNAAAVRTLCWRTRAKSASLSLS